MSEGALKIGHVSSPLSLLLLHNPGLLDEPVRIIESVLKQTKISTIEYLGTLFTCFEPTEIPPDKLTLQLCCLICVKNIPDMLILTSSCDILQLFLVYVCIISGGIAAFRNTSIAYLAYKSASRFTLRSIFMFLQGPEHFTMYLNVAPSLALGIIWTRKNVKYN